MEKQEKQVDEVVEELVSNIVKKTTSYVWYSTEEPFYSTYKDNVCYDYSGNVREATVEDIDTIASNLGKNPESDMYMSLLDELLNSIYINEWRPSYESNYGKIWTTFSDLLINAFEEWKSETYELMDEDGDYSEGMEEFAEKLDYEIESFLIYTPPDSYVEILKQNIEDRNKEI